jgi:hypothetical protein
MVMQHFRPWLIWVVAFITANCNLEVGNPDNAAGGINRRGGINSISMALLNYEPCAATEGACTAVPIRLADGASVLTFEMTEAKLQLSALTLKPLSSETVLTQVDLLSGSEIVLSQNIDAGAVTAAEVKFSGDGFSAINTYSIAGRLLLHNSWSEQSIPLSLTYSSPIVATSGAAPAGAESLTLLFDAGAWFDFSAAPASLKQLLAVPVCKTADSRSCEQYRVTVARLIADGIARSMQTSDRRARAQMRAK